MRPSSLFRLLAHMRGVVRESGGRGLVAKVRHFLSPQGLSYRIRKIREDRAFDARFGTDTGGVSHIRTLRTLGPHGASGTDHVASPRAEFEAALSLLDLPETGLTFIDLGSGKGRAVMFAAEHRFRRVVGVEFAVALHDAAVANIAARASKQGEDSRIALIHGDAAAFAFPGEPLLLFLFNPFGPPVIDGVAAAALASWRADPRPIRVLYMNALHLESFTRAGWRLLRLEQGAALLAPDETV